METFAQRLRQILDERGMSAATLSRKTGLSKPLLSQYLHDQCKASSFQLIKLAETLEVSESWLMGFDVPKEREGKVYRAVEKRRIPLLGEISCGVPKITEEYFETYVEAGTDLNCDFCLTARGDSMIGARIYDGDTVFIKQQPLVRNGEIAAVIIDNETTLKRVFYSKNKLVLQAENPAYPPLVYVGEELNTIRIIGKAISFMSEVK